MKHPSTLFRENDIRANNTTASGDISQNSVDYRTERRECSGGGGGAEWKPNTGEAATRNRCIATAAGLATTLYNPLSVCR